MALTITFPPAAAIEILDESNWPTWSARMLALFRMNGLRDHFTGTRPADAAEAAIWDAAEGMLLGVLEVYTKKDVWTCVMDDTKFGTCKLKWDELQRTYGGTGSMSTFNTWVSLTGTALDESSPMLPQLHKLNEARTTLRNNNMEITNLQFIIKALPESYSLVTLMILASRSPLGLSPQMQTIQEWILNEESCWTASSASLNKVAPIKSNNSNNKKKSKCGYCKIPSHKATDCHKKK